jgi:hypothetical protein
MSTTLATIRTEQSLLIHGLVPTQYARHPFRRHVDSVPFEAWVEANPQACFRRFEILTGLDLEAADDMTDGELERTRTALAVRVAYPTDGGMYGIENERDMEDLMDEDFALLDQAIGAVGNFQYVAGQDACELQGTAVEEAGTARVLAINYTVQFTRSV